jgi:hypothetical protein
VKGGNNGGDAAKPKDRNKERRKTKLCEAKRQSPNS